MRHLHAIAYSAYGVQRALIHGSRGGSKPADPHPLWHAPALGCCHAQPRNPCLGDRHQPIPGVSQTPWSAYSAFPPRQSRCLHYWAVCAPCGEPSRGSDAPESMVGRVFGHANPVTAVGSQPSLNVLASGFLDQTINVSQLAPW